MGLLGTTQIRSKTEWSVWNAKYEAPEKAKNGSCAISSTGPCDSHAKACVGHYKWGVWGSDFGSKIHAPPDLQGRREWGDQVGCYTWWLGGRQYCPRFLWHWISHGEHHALSLGRIDSWSSSWWCWRGLCGGWLVGFVGFRSGLKVWHSGCWLLACHARHLHLDCLHTSHAPDWPHFRYRFILNLNHNYFLLWDATLEELYILHYN